MSTVRKYQVRLISDIEITIINKEELHNLITKTQEMMLERINRIKPFLRSASIGFAEGNLIIYDELNIETHLRSILESFGYYVHTPLFSKEMGIQKGTMYQLTDQIIEALGILGQQDQAIESILKDNIDLDSNLSKLLSIAVNEKGYPVLSTGLDDILEDKPEVKEVIANLLQGNQTMIQEETLIEKYERDGMLIDEQIISRSSMSEKYQIAKETFTNLFDSLNKNHKQHMMNGITRSIEVRASQLGYLVKKESKEQVVNLTLIRSE